MRLIPNKEPVQKPAEPNRTPESGFVENWGAALGLAMSEDLPILSRMLPTEARTSREKRVYDAIKAGDIPYSVASFYGDDINGLAGYAKETLGLPGFFTDEEYHEQVKEEYAARREYSESVFERASGMGLAGKIAGYGHAMALDPIYAVSMLTGYGAASTVGRAFLYAGAVEAGVETVAQVPKMSFKQSIESQYSGADALTEIAFAGLGAGTIAALGKGLSKMLTPKDLTVGQAVETLEKIADAYPEMQPVMNTLKHADPEDNLHKVLTADEAVDARRVDEGPPRLDPRSEQGLKAEEVHQYEEEIFNQRQPAAPEEGVPRGTPDTRHSLVVEADNEVIKISDTIQRMEECF